MIATERTPPSGLKPHMDFFFLAKFGLGGNRSVFDFDGERFFRILEDAETGRCWGLKSGVGRETRFMLTTRTGGWDAPS